MKLFLINFFDSTEKPEIQIYLLVRTKDGQAKDRDCEVSTQYRKGQLEQVRSRFGTSLFVSVI